MDPLPKIGLQGFYAILANLAKAVGNPKAKKENREWSFGLFF